MKTTYPETFNIEFDPDELALAFAEGYRATSLMSFATVGIFGWLALFTLPAKYFEEQPSLAIPLGLLLLLLFVGCTLLMAGVVWLFAEITLRTYGKRKGAQRAASFSARVEGAFLRIMDGKSDRKIHFRQIGDYEALLLDRKVKSKAGSLQMRCPSMGTTGAMLTLHGVKDVIKTRDLLAEVDAERE